MLCPSLPYLKIESDRERGNRKGWGLLSVTLSVCVCVKKRALCSQVSYALVTMPEGVVVLVGSRQSLTAAGHVERLSYLLSAALSDHSDTAP